ncbi:DUF3788 family protein [Enterococcus casseliflavus]|nr:DUF3788 family protein [Enterococcus casseliflavus]
MSKEIKSYDEVKTMLGSASEAWEMLVGYIRNYYIMDELWAEGNPNHKHYHNLRFRRGGKTLITLSIRQGYFIASIVLGKRERETFEEERELLSKKVSYIYDQAKTYHDGKWLGFDIYDNSLCENIIRLLSIKRKPNRKILPDDRDKSGQLDLGMSHEEISTCLFQ